MNQFTPSIIIDAGTLNCKAGLANYEGPKFIFPTNQNGTPNQKFPIQDGVIKLWDQYENLLHHIFYDKLTINSKEYACFITEVPNNTKINKELIIQMIFEKLESKLFYLQQQSPLTIISQGKQTGMVLDSGEGLTYIVPIFEGYQIPHAIKTINFAGRSCTNWFTKILNETGIRLEDQNIVQDIKQKLSYIALNYFKELQKQDKDISQPYQLPDGTILNVSNQRFRCPEILFQPHLLGYDIQGVHQQTYQQILYCDQEIRHLLFQNITLSGGNTMFQGFGERLKTEISLMTNEQVSINASHNRQYGVWIGGSILTSLDSFKEQWITQQEYNDVGPQVIHRKCI